MIIARYSFGYFGAAAICAYTAVVLRSCYNIHTSFHTIALANIVTFFGFLILNVILGGQALASASSGNLSWDVGIVIISLISLFVRILTLLDKSFRSVICLTAYILRLSRYHRLREICVDSSDDCAHYCLRSRRKAYPQSCTRFYWCSVGANPYPVPFYS